MAWPFKTLLGVGYGNCACAFNLRWLHSGKGWLLGAACGWWVLIVFLCGKGDKSLFAICGLVTLVFVFNLGIRSSSPMVLSGFTGSMAMSIFLNLLNTIERGLGDELHARRVLSPFP
ncbi:hypothetical protein [Vulcanisaeta sp. JCM 14467]|uniref:hypothetical protein n=1 Tax=Vulcanisaeta sp. JCM 14467 TaxID=1295370 RepID=UPI0020932227|nr:hypothetical protein [Vulcanisaeta sp. JCM 14467]